MSVFSIIKRSRQQAKEHNQKQTEKSKVDAPKTPYRHVPTHAAVDALSGAPSSWKHEDRPKIVEQNRRRSAMAASGVNVRMPGPSLPRVSSSLSHVTYPTLNANPVGHLPRAHSYSGVPLMMPWQERNLTNKSSIYSVPDSTRISLKGKEVDRSYESGRNSPSYPKDRSPVGSSSRSTSSQEDLEMKPSRHISMPTTSPSSSSEVPHNPSVSAHAHRLHPSARHPSDASDPGDGSPNGQQPLPPADRCKPPLSSNRGFSSIPLMASLSPMQFGNSMVAQQTTQLVASSSASTRSSAQGSFSYFNSNANNGRFSPPMSGRSSVATTPAACSTPEPVWESVEEEEVTSYTFAPAPVAPAPPALKQKDRRGSSKSKVARFTELDKIESQKEQPTGVLPENNRLDSTPPEVSNDVINKAIAVELITIAPSEVTSAPKSGKRLSKQPGTKPTKKNRWTTRSSAVEV